MCLMGGINVIDTSTNFLGSSLLTHARTHAS
jgi:hypothetical protein